MRAEPTEFAERVLDVVAAIPAGQVRSYAQVAQAAGSRAPRAVGATLARFGGGVPWWRVVRSDGSLVPGLAEQAAARLAAEGVTVCQGPRGWRVRDIELLRAAD